MTKTRLEMTWWGQFSSGVDKPKGLQGKEEEQSLNQVAFLNGFPVVKDESFACPTHPSVEFGASWRNISSVGFELALGRGHGPSGW